MKGTKGQDNTTADHTRLITDSYRSANRLMHEVGFGKGGYQWAPAAIGLIMMTRASRALSIKSVLDYGCGQGTLQWVLIDLLQQHGLVGQVTVDGYDPASPNELLHKQPEPADLVTCTDVLEHIEPHLLGNVLNHIASLANLYVIFSVAMLKSKQILPNGQNAHLIQENGSWWRNKLRQYFTNHDILEIPINKPSEHVVFVLAVKQDHDKPGKMSPIVW